jgi:hypothetical protein
VSPLEKRDIVRIRRLAVAQVVTGILALVGIVGVLIAINDSNQARINARRDSCYLIRGLAITATPPKRKDLVVAYLKKTPLHDCNHYASESK